MVYCENCGHEMSEAAVYCPNCGHPNRSAPPPAPAYRYAGFWIRVLGGIIDGIILGVVGFLFVPGYFVARAARRRTRVFNVGFFFPQFPSTLVSFLYSWLMIGLNDGRTIGAMVVGIKVIRPDGSRVDLGTAAIRQGMAIVSGIPLGLGYFWMLWDREKRTWHDIVANTRVVYYR
jgi:uncharacterized RDD family membrane protein YckC